jgi:Tol biopolymer transport system component
MAEHERAALGRLADEPALESWKEIAAYLRRDVRTVIRWEKSEGLPVHRHQHRARASVYAYPHELEAWRARRTVEEPPSSTLWRRPVGFVTFAASLVLTLITAGDGRLLGTTGTAQEGMVTRLLWAGSEVDTLGAPTSDGRFVAMTDWATGNLAVRDTTTGSLRHLTENGGWEGFAQHAVPSRDGRRIAYGWYNASRFDLRAYAFETASTRVLVADDEVQYVQPFDWTPDSRRVLVALTRTDRRTQLALVDAESGGLQVLKTMDWSSTDWRAPERAAISPDGRFVAYDAIQSDAPANRNIHVLALDGSRDEVVVRHPDRDVVIAWSPAGDRLLFASDRSGGLAIWGLPIADGRPVAPPELIRPDLPARMRTMGLTAGGALYYGIRTGVSDVYVAAFDPGAGTATSPTPLLERFVGWNRSPDWSADGRSIAYVSQREGTPGAMNGTLVIRDLTAGVREREIRPPLPRIGRLARWSPDGRRLLIHGRDAAGRAGLFGIDARTGAGTLLIAEGTPGVVGFLQAPAWSGDGQRIFYLQTTPTASNRPRMRDLRTGEDREISAASTNLFAVSPDDELAVVRAPQESGRGDGLAVLPIRGGALRILFHLDASERIPPWSGLAWTPDSRQILFCVTPAAGNGPFEIRVVDVSGGSPKPIGVAAEEIRDLRVHPDGRQLLFGAGRIRDEIWVMERFLPGPREN